MNLTEQLVDLAKAVECGDPIDWAMLSIDEDNAYRLIAGGVLDTYLATDKEDRDISLLAIVVKLTVENMVLNLKLMK
jgi:hypothetical protein